MTPQRYRTSPPPRHATQAELTAWAVREGKEWPGTPMFYYTWWLRRVGKAKIQQASRARDPQQDAQQMELF